MAASNRTRKNPVRAYDSDRDESVYVYGNTVRTAAPQWIPDTTPQLPAPPERREHRRHRKSRQERALELSKVLNLPSIIAMGIAVILAGLSIFNYVGAKSDLDIHARQIKNLTSDLQKAKQVNDAHLMDIEAGINYMEIYDYAINTLGMTFPGKDQVLWYNSTESEYVSQYEALPQK